jgi:cytochrome c-type biogenesis protein CcmH
MKKIPWPTLEFSVALLLVSYFLIFPNSSSEISSWGEAYAQAPAPSDDQVNAIAKQLYCPVCENIPLDVCPTQACAQWRELIREKLAQGWTDQQIKQYFIDQYGDRVVGMPPAHGLNWLVYLLPPVAILFGAFILWRALQAWRTPAPAADPSGSAYISNPGTPASSNLEKDDGHLDDEAYRRRLEEELRKR